MLLALLGLHLAVAQGPDTAIIRAVREAFARAPLEAFGTDTGAATSGDIALLDVDGDGTAEAFVVVHPTFRETPTVVVYKYPPSGAAHRLFEALAPGRLGPSLIGGSHRWAVPAFCASPCCLGTSVRALQPCALGAANKAAQSGWHHRASRMVR